ncbi:hypothetical protein KY290_001671 [Solanum tuberosum]|uniref:Uncharacterized protein n=1 Tax=Solanum tuberosum TaxID=4113 RepID=A0ABQ7WMX6_SOLTU|nr:hypothetical protein KY284_001707 [Solanum tuberosum]KAH0782073.1 hypothetical protein KY290_001671 [Solanum tuberosum]
MVVELPLEDGEGDCATFDLEKATMAPNNCYTRSKTLDLTNNQFLSKLLNPQILFIHSSSIFAEIGVVDGSDDVKFGENGILVEE